MSDHEYDDETVVQPTVARNPLMSSMMDKLRAERDADVPDTADINVPGYRDLLVARYKIVPGKFAAELGKRAQRQFTDEHDRNIWATVDLIIAANTGLYIRNFEEEDPNKQLVPMDPDHEVGDPAAVPLTYSDHRVGELLQIDAPTARDLVYQMFKENDAAIMAHGIILSRWMADTSRGVDETFLGR